MITKAVLEELNEDRLSQDILIPLLRAMGYQDVTYHHGGPGEQGKDITCWKAGDLGNRENIALVVKAVPLSGKASIGKGTAGEVQTQIQQCFGKPFIDPINGTECLVHQCWVVSNKRITKEAKEAIISALSFHRLDRNVLFVGEDKLWELIEKHLPVQSVLDSLQEANKLLDGLDTHYRPRVSLSSSGIEFSLEEKHLGASETKPFTIQATFIFPNTPDGQAMRQAMERHIATGAPVDIPAPYIQNIEFSEPFSQLIGPGDPEKRFLSIGPVRSSVELLVRLQVLCDDGDSASVNYIQLKDVQQGEEEITLSNDGQPIPVQMTLVIHKTNKTVTTNFEFQNVPATPNQFLEFFRLVACLAKPGVVRLIRLDTEFPILELRQTATLHQQVDARVLAEYQDIVAIQSKIKRPIVFPARKLTNDEERMIANLLLIYRVGKLRGKWDEININLTREGAQSLVETFDANGGKFLLEADESEELFGVELPLGRVRYSVYAKLSNRESILKALAEPQINISGIDCKFEPGVENELLKEYLDWIREEPAP